MVVLFRAVCVLFVVRLQAGDWKASVENTFQSGLTHASQGVKDLQKKSAQASGDNRVGHDVNAVVLVDVWAFAVVVIG